MSSDLRNLCDRLFAECADIDSAVAMLLDTARQVRHVSSDARDLLAGSVSAESKAVLGHLEAATERIQLAASALAEASRVGRGYTTSVLGDGSSSTSGPPERLADTETAQDPGSETPSTSVPSLSDIASWLPEVNAPSSPFMASLSELKARQTNCGSCALSVFQRLSGHDDTARAGTQSLSLPEMEHLTGIPQVPMSPKDIADGLRTKGAGSHAVVGIDRAGKTPGHWFNAYFDGERVYCVDAQSGSVSGWPPDYSFPGYPVINWDAAIEGPK